MQTPKNSLSLPEGFASLEHASGWDDLSARASQWIDALWLQRCILALERALARPSLASLMLFASPDFPGFELLAIVVSGEGHEELGALQARLYRAKKTGAAVEGAPPEHELVELGAQIRQIEQWSRDHPGMRFGALALRALSEKVPIGLKPGMDRAQIAEALGARDAMAAMERAQIDAGTGSGSEGQGARRL